MDGETLNSMVLMQLLVGGLLGTLVSLGGPLFIALVVTKVNVKASLAAFALWGSLLGFSTFVAMGGDVYHTFNATLGYLMMSCFVAVPVLAFVLSHVWPFTKPQEPDNPAHYIFGAHKADHDAG